MNLCLKTHSTKDNSICFIRLRHPGRNSVHYTTSVYGQSPARPKKVTFNNGESDFSKRRNVHIFFFSIGTKEKEIAFFILLLYVDLLLSIQRILSLELTDLRSQICFTCMLGQAQTNFLISLLTRTTYDMSWQPERNLAAVIFTGRTFRLDTISRSFH